MNMNAEAAPPTPIDISSELHRTYTYGQDREYVIQQPSQLYLLDGGKSHRVVDAHGVTHRPERGWVGISWRPKAGAPAVVA